MRWFLRAYTNHISLIRQGKKPDSSFLGSFFDTWEEAHTALVKREEERGYKAEAELKRAKARLLKAMKMIKPEEK